MKGTIKRLFAMQLAYAGIPEDIYHFLPEKERGMLVGRKGRFFIRDSERKKIRVVLTGGVFDVLHIGHVVTLMEAKRHGDMLVVAIAQDAHIRNKRREPVHPMEYRRMMVEFLKPVDSALPGFVSPEKMVELVGPDVIVYGYDQKDSIRPKGVKVVKLERKIDDSKFKTAKILDELGI